MSDKWIKRLVPWPVTSSIVLAVIAISFCLAGNHYSNGMCIIGVIVGFMTSVAWYTFNRDVAKWKELDSGWDDHHYTFFCFPGVLILLLFTSTFVASKETTKVWIANGRTTVNHSAIWAVPFYHNIQSVNTELTTDEYTVAVKTSDDVKLEVHTWTDMQLKPDNSLLLTAVQEHVDAELALKAELNKLLTKRLTAIIEQNTMQELRNQFSEDRTWLTTEDGEKIKTLSGATWSGSSIITELTLELK